MSGMKRRPLITTLSRSQKVHHGLTRSTTSSNNSPDPDYPHGRVCLRRVASVILTPYIGKKESLSTIYLRAGAEIWGFAFSARKKAKWMPLGRSVMVRGHRCSRGLIWVPTKGGMGV
jgi:hypothetical protein